MGLKNIGPVGLAAWVGDWRRDWDAGTWDWDLLGSAWMEEAHLSPKEERRTKHGGRASK